MFNRTQEFVNFGQVIGLLKHFVILSCLRRVYVTRVSPPASVLFGHGLTSERSADTHTPLSGVTSLIQICVVPTSGDRCSRRHCDNWALVPSAPITQTEGASFPGEELSSDSTPIQLQPSAPLALVILRASNVIWSRPVGPSRCCGYITLRLAW